MDKKHVCNRCGGDLEEGFVGSKTDSGKEIREDWGTGLSFLGNGLENSRPVVSYRCKKCGFLESYAR